MIELYISDVDMKSYVPFNPFSTKLFYFIDNSYVLNLCFCVIRFKLFLHKYMRIFWYADFMMINNEILILLKSPFDFISMGSFDDDNIFL